MPTIHIQNNSSHPQTFEIHGFPNNPATITIAGHGGTGAVKSPNHQQVSGAIIALHEGHEGEQAEVTFNGFPNGENQYYDISYIVGVCISDNSYDLLFLIPTYLRRHTNS